MFKKIRDSRKNRIFDCKKENGFCEYLQSYNNLAENMLAFNKTYPTLSSVNVSRR